MIRCKKCDVLVDTIGETCPLCGVHLKKNPTPTYPKITTKSTWLFIKRTLLLLVILITGIVVVINRLLNPDTRWSIFVFAGLLSMYTIFLNIMKGRKRVFSMMFSICFVLILITVFWDNLFGFNGWSLNFVLPSLAISYGLFLLILRFVANFLIIENMHFIYLHLLLEFLPLILLKRGIVTFEPLALISALFGTINLAILIIFDFSHLKKDLAMRLHI